MLLTEKVTADSNDPVVAALALAGASRWASRPGFLADAIHLATAIGHGAGEFHTFDQELLDIGEVPELEGLRTRKPPRTPQPLLALEAPKAEAQMQLAEVPLPAPAAAREASATAQEARTEVPAAPAASRAVPLPREEPAPVAPVSGRA